MRNEVLAAADVLVNIIETFDVYQGCCKTKNWSDEQKDQLKKAIVSALQNRLKQYWKPERPIFSEMHKVNRTIIIYKGKLDNHLKSVFKTLGKPHKKYLKSRKPFYFQMNIDPDNVVYILDSHDYKLERYIAYEKQQLSAYI